MSTSRTATPGSTAGLLGAGLICAAIGNLVIAFVAHAAGVSDDFRQLHPATFLPLTVIGYLAGAVGWSVIRSRSGDPASLLRKLVPVVLVLTFVPDVGLLLADGVPGVSAGAVLSLVLMHLMVAAFALPAYATALPVTSRLGAASTT